MGGNDAAYAAYLRTLHGTCAELAESFGLSEARALDWAAAQVYDPEGRRLMPHVARQVALRRADAAEAACLF